MSINNNVSHLLSNIKQNYKKDSQSVRKYKKQKSYYTRQMIESFSDELQKLELIPCESFLENPVDYINSLPKKQRAILHRFIILGEKLDTNFCSHRHLGETSGSSISTTQRLIRQLKADGLLVSIQPLWNSSCFYKLSSIFRAPGVTKLLKGIFPILGFVLHISILASGPTSNRNDRVTNKEKIYLSIISNKRTHLEVQASKKISVYKKTERRLYSQEPGLCPDEINWLREDKIDIKEVREYCSLYGLEAPIIVVEEDFKVNVNKALALPEDTLEQRSYKRTRITIAKEQDATDYKKALKDSQKGRSLLEQVEKRSVMINKKEIVSEERSKQLEKRQKCSQLIPQYVKDITEIELTSYGQIFLSLIPESALVHALESRDKSLTGLDSFNNIFVLGKEYLSIHDLEYNTALVNEMTALVEIPPNPRLVFRKKSESPIEDSKPKTIQQRPLETQEKSSERSQIIDNGRSSWNKQRHQRVESSLTSPSYKPFKAEEINIEHVCIHYHRYEEYLASEAGQKAMSFLRMPNPHIKNYNDWINEPGNTPQKGLEIYRRNRDL